MGDYRHTEKTTDALRDSDGQSDDEGVGAGLSELKLAQASSVSAPPAVVLVGHCVELGVSAGVVSILMSSKLAQPVEMFLYFYFSWMFFNKMELPRVIFKRRNVTH